MCRLPTERLEVSQMSEREAILTSNERYCANSKYTGIHVDGAFAEYEILDSRHLVPIPDDLPFDQASQRPRGTPQAGLSINARPLHSLVPESLSIPLSRRLI